MGQDAPFIVLFAEDYVALRVQVFSLPPFHTPSQATFLLAQKPNKGVVIFCEFY